MIDRNYEGEPLDLTMTHLSETSSEVPSDSATYEGDTKTTFGGSTDLKKKIRELDMINPQASTRDIASELDCDHVYVSEVLNQSDSELYGRYRKEKWSEYPEKYRQIIKLHRSGECDSRAEIARLVDVSGALVTKVLEANSHILDL